MLVETNISASFHLFRSDWNLLDELLSAYVSYHHFFFIINEAFYKVTKNVLTNSHCHTTIIFLPFPRLLYIYCSIKIYSLYFMRVILFATRCYSHFLAMFYSRWCCAFFAVIFFRCAIKPTCLFCAPIIIS